jgi:hypothetical protein
MDELQFEKLGFRSKLVQVFSGKPEEWRRFKVKLQAALEESDLLETLESEKPVVAEGATQGERKALANWVKNDRKIYSKLILYTSNDAGSLVEQFESSRSGKLAWDALKAKYDPQGRAGKVDLYRDLMAVKLENGEDPDKLFLRMEGNRRQLQDMEQTVSDEMLLGMTLSKLPPSYDTLVTILEADDELKYDDMKEQVRAYWKRKVKGSLSRQDAVEVKALAAAEVKQKGACYGCGLTGHIKVNCPKNTQGNTGGGWRAYGKHRGGDDGGDRRGGQDRPFKGLCHVCSREGHKAMNCPRVMKNQKDEMATVAMYDEDVQILAL